MLEHRWLGRMVYRDVLAMQLAARERVWAGDDGVVLLCEHPPTITLGRSAKRENILASDEALAREEVAVEKIERGGDVTYHGPGQLVIYPIVKLHRGVIDFLDRVANAIIDGIRVVGVHGAAWQRDPAGVWIGDAPHAAKIAACGIHVARGVSVHGFALDVATPAAAWALIRPCGLAVPQTSVVAQCEREVSVEAVAGVVGPLVVTALAR
ncbi:MAG: lipoyl(octanoyl) transferase LipB [Kofleriaceae bacterium]